MAFETRGEMYFIASSGVFQLFIKASGDSNSLIFVFKARIMCDFVLAEDTFREFISKNS